MKNKIVRSTKIKLNYANKSKKDDLFVWLNQYATDIFNEKVNELLYSDDKIPTLLPKSFTEQLPFSSRINQLLAKEISSVARSARNKIEKAIKKHNKQKYQQEIIDKFNVKSLKINWNGALNLDSRFVSIEQNKSSKQFDYWLHITYPKMNKFYIPFKLTRHMEKLLKRGYELKTNSIKITRNNEIHLFFSKEVENKQTGNSLGIDVGRNKAFVTSNNTISILEIKDILNSLKKQKHGSKKKKARISKMKQLIDLSVKNNINWSDLQLIILEDLNDMKRNNKWGNVNHHWSASYIQNRIRLLAQELGVQVQLVNPAYTSQTCSKCGHTHKSNRNGEKFKCVSCNYEIDADLNGAINICKRGTNSVLETKKISRINDKFI